MYRVYVKCKLVVYISDLCEGLPATAVLDGLYCHWDFDRVSFRHPKTLRKDKIWVKSHTKCVDCMPNGKTQM